MNMEPYSGQTKFKCFNNQDIPIIGQIHMELHSGSWTAKKLQHTSGKTRLTKPDGKGHPCKTGTNSNTTTK